VKNAGLIKWALRILIECDKEKGVVNISQGQFVREAPQRFGFDGDCSKDSPVYNQGPNSVMDDDVLSRGSEEMASLQALYPYDGAIGGCWWLANISRQGISFTVFQGPQDASKPSKKVWVWITMIFSYLSVNPERGLVYLHPVVVGDEKFAVDKLTVVQKDKSAQLLCRDKTLHRDLGTSTSRFTNLSSGFQKRYSSFSEI
jgi:hypothetical protein